MIGLTILAVRSSTPASLIPETFGPSRIHIPKAPGLGLLLLEPQYLEYNKRVTEANTKLEDLNKAGRLSDKDLADQRRDPLDSKGLGLTEKIDEFKKEQVYKRMRQVEEEELTFSKWLNYLDVHIGSDFEYVHTLSSAPLDRVLTGNVRCIRYLNPKGVIPVSAVFKKGENPERPRGPADVKEGEAALPPSDDEGAGAGEDDG